MATMKNMQRAEFKKRSFHMVLEHLKRTQYSCTDIVT